LLNLLTDYHVAFAFLGLGVAMAIVWALTPVVAGFARRFGAMDEPEARKIHAVATPRLGGIAIFFGVMIPSLFFLSGDRTVRGILLGACLVTLVGFLDDVRGMSPLVKLGGQVVVAGILAYYGVRVQTLALPGIGILSLGWTGIVFSMLWIVAIMNIVNFIDGMDGLAAGVCGISAITFSIIAISLGRFDMGILAAIVAGSTLGFLWHNFYPASIFMGDSGSMLLGFLLAVISLEGPLKGVATVALVIPLLVLGIPIFDTGFAILRRVKNRRPIYLADRGHLHHRFANLGYSQRNTVIILYSWSGLMSLLALAMRFAPRWLVIIVAVIVGAVSLYLAYVVEIFRWSKVQMLLGGRRPERAQVVEKPVDAADKPVAASTGLSPDSSGEPGGSS
jgi:UDP-GlcNAc:undecaprenyl-phosphate/decaprenyl-phosphate GlcNAc-1-phosphate transferase